MLYGKKISRKLPEYTEIKNTIRKSFDSGALPISFLMLMSKRKIVDFLAYYDETEFIGLSYELKSKDMSIVMYVAVKDDTSKYDKDILGFIKQKNKNKEIVVSVNRLSGRTYNFYLDNDFIDTGCYIEDGSQYLILSSKENFNQNEYKKLLKQYSYGLYNPQLRN